MNVAGEFLQYKDRILSAVAGDRLSDARQLAAECDAWLRSSIGSLSEAEIRQIATAGEDLRRTVTHARSETREQIKQLHAGQRAASAYRSTASR